MSAPSICPISDDARRWRAFGEHGISSEYLFDRLLLGVTDSSHVWTYPHDPDDLKRCEKLLRMVPELRSRLCEMAGAGPVWGALVGRWGEIVVLLEDEIPGVYDGRTGRAPHTYELMRSIMDSAS